MKISIYLIALFSLVFFGLLVHHQSSAAPLKKVKSTFQTDPPKTFKIGRFRAIPKKLFMFNSIKVTGDTLSLVICGDYVYAPFGSIKNKHSFKSSLLKNFTVRDKIETTPIGHSEFQTLSFKSSRLLFFFDNDPGADPHSYIFKGEINDSEVFFDKNIRIGMNISGFYDVFFTNFPKQLNYKVISIISCVDDIKQIYSFQNNMLKSVVFINDTNWKISY